MSEERKCKKKVKLLGFFSCQTCFQVIVDSSIVEYTSSECDPTTLTLFPKLSVNFA